MATTSNSVVAFFSNESKASEAIDALQSAGFHAREIGAATNAGYGSTASPASYGTGTSTASHSTTGAKSEGVWDKVKNFFDGDNTEGGVEQYADERAHDNSTHEITRGGYPSGYDYEAGDVSHSLSGMSIPEDRSRYFENQFSSGKTGVLVTVTPTAGREAEAERILVQHGGDLGNNNTVDYAATDVATPTTDVTAAGQQRIQLLGEVLRVHKDRISRGEVRIRKEVITEQQTIQVPVTREELVIERIPVTGQTTPAGTIGESSEIRIPLTEERAFAEKQTLVREEVAVGKRAVEEVREVGGAVRHEELQVEDETGTVGTSGTTRKL